MNSVIDSAAAPAPGSLRYAVNSSSPGDTITFAPTLSGQTITLDTSSPENHLVISHDLSIQGPGASLLTISGGSGTRIFFIAGGTVTISGVTLANGLAQGGAGGSGAGGGGGAAGMGGAVFINSGNVTISNVTFTGNIARGGAGGAGGTSQEGGGGGGGFGGPGSSSTGLNSSAPGGSGGDLGQPGGAGAAGSLAGCPPQNAPAGGFGAGGGGGGTTGCTFGESGPEVSDGGSSAFGGGGGGAGNNTEGTAGGFGGGAGGSGGFGGGSGANTYQSGSTLSGGGGGGGAGLGGAVFAAGGNTLITGSTFSGNQSIGGAAGNGAAAGQAKGGALFKCQGTFYPSSFQIFCGGSGAAVIVSNSTFQGNIAADAGVATTCPGRDDADVCGFLTGAIPTHFGVLGVLFNSVFYTGIPQTIGIAALDGNNDIVFSYSGRVHFTSTDSAATLPPDSSLAQGIVLFPITMQTPGTQLITATEVNGSVTGTFPINVVYQPVTSLEASPASGSGNSQTFSFTFTDPSGYQDLDVVNVLINNALDGRNACYLAYSRPLDVLYLVNDAGAALSDGLVLNSSGAISNGQCTVTSAVSSATGSGDTLILSLGLTFTPQFERNQIIYMAAGGISFGNSGWQPAGVWTVPGATPTSPAVTGLSPAYSIQPVGTPFTFTLTFTDFAGSQDLGILDILINSSLDGRQACYIAYSVNASHFYLVNDTGTGLVPDPPPNFTYVSNNQCALVTAASTAVATGNTITLTLEVNSETPFQGNRVVYAAARSAGDVSNSGWQPVGVIRFY